MSGYTKLHSWLVTSTVWAEPDSTRIVWITMLAIADADGTVNATIPGLAHIARVSIEATRKAIDRFTSPDPDSRDPSNEGRRVERVGGIFRLLNYAKYRAERSIDVRREYQRDWVAKKRCRQLSTAQNDVYVDTIDSRQPSTMSTHAEAEAYAYGKDLSTTKHLTEIEKGKVDERGSGGEEPKFEPPPTAEILEPETTPKAQKKKSNPDLEGTGDSVFEIPCVGGQSFHVRRSLFNEWSTTFPGVDVRMAIARAKQWLADNPTRGKTYRGARKFLGSWLGREQDRAAGTGPPRNGSRISGGSPVSHDWIRDPVTGQVRTGLVDTATGEFCDEL